VYLVGFSGGAAFAGGLLLADPARWAGTAILNGTLPFDAGVPTTAGHQITIPTLEALSQWLEGLAEEAHR
jgi:phospholipase/carboxylesterase